MSRAKGLCVVLMLFAGISGFSQSYPSGFAQSLVSGGIPNPTVMAFAPDGRIFVARQSGQLVVIKNGTLLTTPFIELTVDATNERGLIGIALDPGFATNHFVYLYYTVPGSPAHNRISRFTANGDVVLAGSAVTVLDIDPLSAATNHNGGAMAFGPDGKLYIAVGENANGANAQNLDTHLGKILRINPDGSVPSGNPFTSGSEQKKRMWAYGLRNPYTISFQPGTGKLFVNDVGQDTWEEINDATLGGRNFGWPTAEGTSANPNFVNPIYTYQHGSGDGLGCAITGGTIFNPSSTNYPGSYYGRYFFMDYCNFWINAIDPLAGTVVRIPFATSISGFPVILQVGNDGNLYYLSRGTSAIWKIIYSSGSAPFITSHPATQQVVEEASATFTVAAVGTSPFTYQWQKENVNIPGATNSSLTITNAQPADAGHYRVIVSNAAGDATSNTATLTVIPVNDLPTATITSPAAGTHYVAGGDITFSGTGTDIEDGTLPASAFSWQIDFHHNTHKHDQPPITGITSGTYHVPNQGETSDNVWYRIILTVMDSDGLTAVDSVDVLPQKSTLSFATDPPGLKSKLDGQPFNTPSAVVSVEGILRTIDAVSPQTLGGVEYEFSSWSHGGAMLQTIATPTNDITYTAHFAVVADLPTATITSPAAGTHYVAGGDITFSGTGTDIEDGTLPASAFSWQIDFHHNTHKHDQPPITGITSGTYAIPNEGETSANVWYRIILTVMDSDGLTAVDSVDVLPQKSTLSFATDPPGLQLKLDGQPFNTPSAVISVEGILRTIDAVSPQSLGGVEYEFSSWSTGGAMLQTIATPTDDITYTADFSVVAGVVNSDRLDELQIYPNPIEGGIVVINIQSASATEGTVHIMDVLSRRIIKRPISLVPGDNSIEIPVSELSRGVHIAIVEIGRRKVSRKVLVR